jgi:hypothetical protein
MVDDDADFVATPKHLKMARTLAKLDASALYEMIGTQILVLENPTAISTKRGMSGFSVSTTSAKSRGRKFFEDRKKILTDAICVRWQYCEKATEYEGDFTKLMTALIPLIIRVLDTQIAGLAIVTAVLLFKYGLRDFCDCR